MLTHLRPRAGRPVSVGLGPTWSPTNAGSRLRGRRLASAPTAPPARIRRPPCLDRPPSVKAEGCVTAVRLLLLPRRSSGPLAWGVRRPGCSPPDHAPAQPSPKPAPCRGSGACGPGLAAYRTLSRSCDHRPRLHRPLYPRGSGASATLVQGRAPAPRTQARLVGTGAGVDGLSLGAYRAGRRLRDRRCVPMRAAPPMRGRWHPCPQASAFLAPGCVTAHPRPGPGPGSSARALVGSA
jgi:hypothetical protein